MNTSSSMRVGLSALLLVALSGCGSKGGGSGDSTGNGGDSTSSGGETATGGSNAGGASSASGGQSASGGATGSSGGGETSTGGLTGSGGVAPSSGGASASSGGTSASSGGASPSSGGASSDAGSGGSGTTCASPAWDVTYSMDGSTFDVRDTPLGAGDQANTATPPYTAPNEIGPGTMVIRFKDSGGNPGPGTAHIMSYTMNLEFTVNGGGGSASVHNELTEDAVAGACGAATGTYAAPTITWNAPGFASFHTYGTVTCSGNLCTLGGLPDGTAQPQDTTTPLTLNPFTFASGVTKFTMPEVQNSKDSKSSTWIAFTGTETSRKAVCDCN